MNQSKMNFNWPELTTICGCLSLNTGIYIIGVYHTLVNLYMSIVDVRNIVRGQMYNEEFQMLLNNSDYLNDELKSYISLGFGVMLTHQMAWVSLQITLFLSMVVLLYGVFMRLPKLIKIYLYLNLPSYVFVAFVNGIDFMFYETWTRLAAVSFTLLGGFQLLAARSVYRRLTGKTAVIESDDVLDIITNNENSTEGVSTPVYTFSLQPVYRPTFKHCHTCTCSTPNSPSSESQVPPISIPSQTRSSFGNQTSPPAEEPPDLDPKDQPMVFDESQLRRGHPLLDNQSEPIQGTSVSRSSERPTTLDQVKTEEEKRKTEDEAVIYDEDQLTVGRSQIFDTVIRTV